jgi:hypothetical protein
MILNHSTSQLAGQELLSEITIRKRSLKRAGYSSLLDSLDANRRSIAQGWLNRLRRAHARAARWAQFFRVTSGMANPAQRDTQESRRNGSGVPEWAFVLAVEQGFQLPLKIIGATTLLFRCFERIHGRP